MAETKRARAIRAEKEKVIDQIKQLHEQLRAACLSVPQRVLRGSHQDAVAWKDLAEKVLYGSSGIPQSGSLRSLLARLSDKRETLKRLS